MRVKSVKNGLFKDTVVLIADEDDNCIVYSFMGSYEYYVEEGEKVRIKVPKSWCAEVGDEYNLETLVIYCGGLSNAFSRRWA